MAITKRSIQAGACRERGSISIHKRQWRRSLEVEAAPLADMPIDAIETVHVYDVVQFLWLKTPETASRLRGRLERLFAFAKSPKGYRRTDQPNPALFEDMREGLGAAAGVISDALYCAAAICQFERVAFGRGRGIGTKS
jgi:hypothetical protein